MAATGDLNPLYEQERLIPPAMAAVFTRWEALSGEELLPGTIHAGQAFRYLRPLHWGDKVVLQGKAVEKMEKRGLKFVCAKYGHGWKQANRPSSAALR